MNTITLIPAVEESRHVLSIVIDGPPLRELFAGRSGGLPPQVSPFGWNRESDIREARKFLLEGAPEFDGGRYAILVCDQCGDRGCGAYSARIERDAECIRWSALGFQNDHDEESLETSRYENVGPFEFAWTAYEAVFRPLVTTPNALREQTQRHNE